METIRYEYGVGTETTTPIIMYRTKEQAEEKMKRLQERYPLTWPLVIWRRPISAWERVPIKEKP